MSRRAVWLLLLLTVGSVFGLAYAGWWAWNATRARLSALTAPAPTKEAPIEPPLEKGPQSSDLLTAPPKPVKELSGVQPTIKKGPRSTDLLTAPARPGAKPPEAPPSASPIPQLPTNVKGIEKLLDAKFTELLQNTSGQQNSELKQQIEQIIKANSQ